MLQRTSGTEGGLFGIDANFVMPFLTQSFNVVIVLRRCFPITLGFVRKFQGELARSFG